VLLNYKQSCIVLTQLLFYCICATFYRAEPIAECGIAKASCPSVCLSVTLRYRDHKIIVWNSAKVISRLISRTISLSADPNKTDLLQREHPQILAGIGVG